MGDKVNLAWLYQHLSEASMMPERYEDAIELIQKSSFCAEKVNQIIVVDNREILGMILRKMGNYPASIAHLIDAMMMFLD